MFTRCAPLHVSSTTDTDSGHGLEYPGVAHGGPCWSQSGITMGLHPGTPSAPQRAPVAGRAGTSSLDSSTEAVAFYGSSSWPSMLSPPPPPPHASYDQQQHSAANMATSWYLPPVKYEAVARHSVGYGGGPRGSFAGGDMHDYLSPPLPLQHWYPPAPDGAAGGNPHPHISVEPARGASAYAYGAVPSTLRDMQPGTHTPEARPRGGVSVDMRRCGAFSATVRMLCGALPCATARCRRTL